MMTKLLAALLAAIALAVAAAATADALGGDTARQATDTTSTTGDVRGPCDEAEHRNDPRCTGATATRDDARKRRRGKAERRQRERGAAARHGRRGHHGHRRDDTRREAGEDVRGPCDEAEHRADPRCAGGTTPRGSDDRSNSGPGGEDDSGRSGDDSGDDRSGSNAGSG